MLAAALALGICQWDHPPPAVHDALLVALHAVTVEPLLAHRFSLRCVPCANTLLSCLLTVNADDVCSFIHAHVTETKKQLQLI